MKISAVQNDRKSVAAQAKRSATHAMYNKSAALYQFTVYKNRLASPKSFSELHEYITSLIAKRDLLGLESSIENDFIKKKSFELYASETNREKESSPAAQSANNIRAILEKISPRISGIN